MAYYIYFQTVALHLRFFYMTVFVRRHNNRGIETLLVIKKGVTDTKFLRQMHQINNVQYSVLYNYMFIILSV